MPLTQLQKSEASSACRGIKSLRCLRLRSHSGRAWRTHCARGIHDDRGSSGGEIALPVADRQGNVSAAFPRILPSRPPRGGVVEAAQVPAFLFLSHVSAFAAESTEFPGVRPG